MSHGVSSVTRGKYSKRKRSQAQALELADRLAALKPLAEAVSLVVDGQPFTTHIDDVVKHLRHVNIPGKLGEPVP